MLCLLAENSRQIPFIGRGGCIGTAQHGLGLATLQADGKAPGWRPRCRLNSAPAWLARELASAGLARQTQLAGTFSQGAR